MSTLEVFFDYTCPYCLRGHEILLELLAQYPQLNVEWFPCEAHPRPEQHGAHSDLCARGMFFAQETGFDLLEYHRRMYRAALTDHADIEDPNEIARLVNGWMDEKKLLEALSGGLYEDLLLRNNQLAWGTYEFPAVPSYRMDGALLQSVGGVGVTKPRLAAFLDAHAGPSATK